MSAFAARRAGRTLYPHRRRASLHSIRAFWCAIVSSRKAKRQHEFEFLRGDTGRRLPVDAYYPELNLVVEYREMQHTQSVPIMDKRMTCSGVPRAEQRRMYDQRRDDVLAQKQIRLVKFDYFDFPHHANCRLKRDAAKDEQIVRSKLLAVESAISSQ